MPLSPTEAARVDDLDKRLRSRGRRDFLLVFLLAVSLILSAGALVFGLVRANRQADSAQTKVGVNERRVVQLQRKVLPIQRVLLRRDVLRVGPRGLTGGRGAFGRPGRSVTGPFGPIGPEGPFGAPGADSIVPGPPGEDSTVPGPPGEDSTVPGPQGEQGPGPTDAQVQAAVAAYLSGRTFTCEPTADPFDSPTTYTCTIDP